MQKETKILTVLALGGAFLSLWTIFGCCAVFRTILGIVGLLIATILCDFVRTRDSSFPLTVSIKKYFLARSVYFLGLYRWSSFQWTTKHIRESQDQVLRMIIKLNGNTEYAKECGLDKVRSREDLVRIHPVSKYQKFASYHERSINGEENVATSQKPYFYGVTSGTTGAPSRIPQVAVQREALFRTIVPLWVYHLSGIAPGIQKLDRRMGLFFNPIRLLQKSPIGVPIGPASATFLDADDSFTTPTAAFDIVDEPSARYVQLLFGLHKRDLMQIESTFCSLVYMGFHEMEKVWKDLVMDIRNGTLKKKLEISSEIREALERRLVAKPERADELQKEFEKGFDNIAKRVWPKLKLIQCITSGAFTHYANIVREKYTKDILMFHPLYAATEGMLGLNMAPEKIDPPVFMIIPYIIFYEFIPIDNIGEANPKTVFLEEVKVGQDYEVVLTTTAGLYRYRLGDVIRVVDFYNQCPVVQIMYRTGQLLSIKGEKVSEISLYRALTETVEKFSDKVKTIIDFTSCESVFLEYLGEDKGDNSTKSPFYVVFLELAIADKEKDISKLEAELSKIMDDRLTANHARYKYQRDKEGLDQLKVFVTKPGAFMGLRKFMLETSTAAPSQLKIPRVLRKPELVRYMLTQRV